jgi:hypothetical protein
MDSDQFTVYELGMQRLLDCLGDKHERYAEVLVYQQRLSENIHETRLFGDTRDREARRAEVIYQLNMLAKATGCVPISVLYNVPRASHQDIIAPRVSEKERLAPSDQTSSSVNGLDAEAGSAKRRNPTITSLGRLFTKVTQNRLDLRNPQRECCFWGSAIGTMLLAISAILLAISSMPTVFLILALLWLLLVSVLSIWLLILTAFQDTAGKELPSPGLGLAQAFSAAIALIWILATLEESKVIMSLRLATANEIAGYFRVGLWICWAGLVFTAVSGLATGMRWLFRDAP